MFRLGCARNRAVLVGTDVVADLATLSGDPSLSDPMAALARADELHDLQLRVAANSPGSTAVDDTVLGVPVPRPQKVFGIGLNYRAHAAETGAELPPAPLTFTKFPSCLNTATGAIPLSGDTVDWEVELVVVIGRGGHDIAENRAWDHVAGLTLGQDISDRTVQRAGSSPQFSLGKSFDGYGPLGPVVVSVDAFPDPDDIGLWCDVSGERMQDGRTDDLIFTVPELVAYLSSICTLLPGDLVFTGTPSGVGAARGRFLRPGDVIESGAEIIGGLRNECVARPVPS
jgi:2-keto-4-pentenoate hydratase/2-oxohepta-3-ene-1,7-dioic acid hydratase in catechol pathway